MEKMSELVVTIHVLAEYRERGAVKWLDAVAQGMAKALIAAAVVEGYKPAGGKIDVEVNSVGFVEKAEGVKH